MRLILIGLLEAEAVWALALIVLLLGAMTMRKRNRRRRERGEAAAPAIREALAVYMGGNSDVTRLRAFRKSHRHELARTIVRFQSRVGGAERERLVELALNFGFVEGWCLEAESRSLEKRREALGNLAALSHSPKVTRLAGEIQLRALSDPDEQVRVQACALVYSDDPNLVSKGFELALTASPLIRLQIAPQLRRHAAMLCESAIPKALRVGHATELVKVLRLLNSWECHLPLADLGDFASHIDEGVRIQAIKLLAQAPPTVENRRALLDGLVDPDPRVAMAAAVSAGRLKLPAVLPRLSGCLRRGNEALAHTAAAALAAMPPLGWQSLKHYANSGDPIASAAARQALQSIQTGPAHLEEVA